MKTIIISAFLASSLLAGPGVLLTTTSASAQTACGPNVPSSWLAPGGFCDQSAGTHSLTLPGTDSANCTSYVYVPIIIESSLAVPKGARVQVADTCSIPCTYTVGAIDIRDLPIGERVRVAQAAECPPD